MDGSLPFIIGQGMRIDALERESARTMDAAGRAKDISGDLRQRVEVMALANQALFELLSDRLGITAEEVLTRMAEIDGRDGRPDGKIGASVLNCPACGRKVSSVRRQCLYCSAPIAEGHVFEKS